jgi:hypothetical protein
LLRIRRCSPALAAAPVTLDPPPRPVEVVSGMNKHIRRVAIAVGVLMVALFLNLNFARWSGRRLSEQFGRRVILTSMRRRVARSSWTARPWRIGRDDRRAEVRPQVPERTGTRR